MKGLGVSLKGCRALGFIGVNKGFRGLGGLGV